VNVSYLASALMLFGKLFQLSVGTFTSVVKDKPFLGSHLTAEIKVFSNFLLVDGRIRKWIRTK
jgi:hypothetical protein